MVKGGAGWVVLLAAGCAGATAPDAPEPAAAGHAAPAADAVTVRAEPTSDPARRAAIAKLGRLAWSDVGQPLAFCDLDGGDVVTSDAGPVSLVRWLTDGRRVFAMRNGRAFVVDSTTGASTDLASDEPKARFAGRVPCMSPDRHFAVCWRMKEQGRSKISAPAAYVVFDLERGTHVDLSPFELDDPLASWTSNGPTAWWSPKGELYALLSAPRGEGEPAGSRWRLVRWSPADGSTTTVAEPPAGTRISEMAFLGEHYAYAVTPEQAHDFVPLVISDSGERLLSLTSRGFIWDMRWESDGAALLVRVQGPGPSTVQHVLRVARGGEPTEVAEFRPPRRVALADGTIVEDRISGEPGEAALFRVAANGDAARICDGAHVVPAGRVGVFWRVCVPDRVQPGPYFEEPKKIPGTDVLWAWDPADGALIRLTDREFTARCWDFFIRPEARTH